jgi:hypothetical protein
MRQNVGLLITCSIEAWAVVQDRLAFCSKRLAGFKKRVLCLIEPPQEQSETISKMIWQS